MADVVPGIYEHVLTKALETGLDPADEAVTESVKAEQIAALVSRHVANEMRRLFAAAPGAAQVDLAVHLADRIFAALGDVAAQHGLTELDVANSSLAPPPRKLMSVGKLAATRPRPQTALSASTLFTRSTLEPRLAAELAHEIECADRVDAIVAFITVGGVRALSDALERLCLQGGSAPRLRVLTTTFTGTTEIEALDRLASLPNAQVKISMDVRRTRLHAKAWLFHRAQQLSTAYVGSANFTSTALGAGHEWMLKVSAADLPHVVDHFAGTFETLWQAVEFESYDPTNDVQRARLRDVLRAERTGDRKTSLTLVTLRPYPFQEAILERLEVERMAGHRRNLVVAATGTGKTVIAAFDYARIAKAKGARPRLLMLAHRYELIEQACTTFRHVLGDASFGELVSGGAEIGRGDHVFATVQSAGRLLETFPADHWTHDWPLALHRQYTRSEILVATGHLVEGDKPRGQMGGIRKDEATKRELFFVTLDKTGGDFSATTRYRDYVLSPELFHWETQGGASVDSVAGRRYLESATNGWRFFLFVQLDKDEPYTFLGEGTYLSHQGDRPIGITWKLEHAPPADLFEKFAVLNQT